MLVPLFHAEEEIFQQATEVLKQFQHDNGPLVKEYKQLLTAYQRLLKQTKLLVKMSDKQQSHLTNRTEELQSSNLQLQNQAAQMVRASEKTLAQFLEAMPVGVYVIDIDGKPYYANQKAQQILGQVWAFEQAQPLMRALRGERPYIDNIEIHRGQETIPVEMWGTPIFDEWGKITFAIAIFQDITLRKQAEMDKIRLIQEHEEKTAALRYSQEIAAKNDELVRLNQEKNEFLGIVAHDLKNPLSAIRGMAELIKESLGRVSQQELLEYATIIEGAAGQMFNLITNLLDVNQIETGQFNLHWQSVNILPIIQSLVRNYTLRATAKNITLISSQSPENSLYFKSMVDENLLYQVLDNLISNAIKYSPLDKLIQVRLLQTKDKIRCEIQDEGPGLSDADQQKLFGKFTRLSPKPTAGEHSTGLGLFIVKKLVEAMKGQVWCESELGKGATFILEFTRHGT